MLKASLTGFKQSGEVYAVEAGDGTLCFLGTAVGLTSNAVCDPATTPDSCGTHVHSGTACTSSAYMQTRAAQGDHWYRASARREGAEEPWKMVGYAGTDDGGGAAFGHCIATGYPIEEALAKPFIVHEQDGSRAMCGLLESYAGESRGWYATAVVAMMCAGTLGLALAYLRYRKRGQRLAVRYPSDLNLSTDTDFKDGPSAQETTNQKDGEPQVELV